MEAEHHSAEPIIARKFTISGKVQGVGFRAFVARTAVLLGLTGEVWNMRAGSVECVALGPTELLAELESKLWKGPGRVDSVVQKEQVLGAVPEQFSIGPSR